MNTKTNENISEKHETPKKEKKLNKALLVNENKGDATNKPLKCENIGCGKKFYKKINFLNHFKLCQYRNKKFKCDIPCCLKSFSSIGNLRKHKIIHQEKKTYTCEFENCKKIFTSMYHLKVLISSFLFYQCELKIFFKKHAY